MTIKKRHKDDDARYSGNFRPDNQGIGGCEHPVAQRFWDIDEWRCRACGRSITFAVRPPPPPLPNGELGAAPHQTVIDLDGWVWKAEYSNESATSGLSCIKCRQWRLPVPDVDGAILCPNRHCRETLAVEGPDGQLHFPPHDPPRLLRCTCCHEDKPQFCFSIRRHPAAAEREYRAHYCRGCAAFRARVKREQRTEEVRARDRERGARYQQSLTPDQRNQQARTSRESVNAAGRRYRARKAGRAVPKQRPGRQAILLKPVCRIAEGCPLRDFCTTELKALA